LGRLKTQQWKKCGTIENAEAENMGTEHQIAGVENT